MTENDEDSEGRDDVRKLNPANSNDWQFEQSELSKYLQKRREEAAAGKNAERDKS